MLIGTKNVITTSFKLSFSIKLTATVYTMYSTEEITNDTKHHI